MSERKCVIYMVIFHVIYEIPYEISYDIYISYIYDEISFSHLKKKKEENLAIFNHWMDLEGIIPSELSQRQILYDLTYL